MKSAFLHLAFVLSLSTFAHDEPISAYRDPRLPYEHYEALMHDEEKYAPEGNKSAIGESRIFTGANLKAATHWPSGTLNERFYDLRDARHLTTSINPSFPRRISWLYPHDGCYARAASSMRYFKKNGIPTPSTVFAFGRLSVKTPWSKHGSVGWWFHVAPIVEVDGERFVLDPSIELKRPLPLAEWVGRMGSPTKIKVSICGSGTFSPGSTCSSQIVGSNALTDQKSFLNKEWENLKRLGKKPEALLGDQAPW